jgi:dTDP-4-dehydrorhamnose 3,5-epimerase-like enzyme
MTDIQRNLQVCGDERGLLAVMEQGKQVPFDIKRVYFLYGTEQNVRRGFHAHRQLRQFAVCAAGSCTMLLDDGKQKQEIRMDSPGQGLMIEPMVWHEMFDFSPDCVLLVLASDIYDESDYIRDYPEFLEALA